MDTLTERRDASSSNRPLGLDRSDIRPPLPGRPLWVIFGSLLAVAVLGFGTFNVVEVLAHEEFRRTWTVPAAGLTRLSVDNDNGRVTIVGTDGDTVQINAEISEGLRRTGFGNEVVDSALEVQGTCPIFGGTWCSVDYTIEVPRNLDVEVNGDSGRVAINDIDGEVVVQSDNGRVELTSIAGPLRVNADNGAIVGTDLSSPAAEFQSDNGRVELRFSQAPDRVTGDGDNGRIEVVVPPNGDEGYDVSVDVDNGDGEILVVNNDNSPHVIDLQSDNGDISVRPTE